MGMFEEKVPKAVLDLATERYLAAEAKLEKALERIEALTDTMLNMRRREGFDTRREPKKPILSPDVARSDEMIVREANQEFRDKYAQDLIDQGADPVAAMREARRVRDEIGELTMQPER